MDALQLPSTFVQFPRIPLLWRYGSPLERLDRLSESVKDTGVGIYAKRDDCCSGLAFGGNKLRALEYILPDVLAKGCDVIVTEGGVQSNSMRQTAAAAAKLGLEVRLVQRPGSSNWDEPSSKAYETLGNVQITKLLSPKYTRTSVTDVISELVESGRTPYHIPAGCGTSLGQLGYARLAFEIIAQEKELGVSFDTIILPSAGGNTAGGMLAGFRSASLEDKACPHATKRRRIISVFVGADVWSLEKPLKNAVLETMMLLRCKSTTDAEGSPEIGDECELEFSFNAGGYGKVDARTIEAMKIAGRLEGLILDPVYTGKAFAAMLDKVKSGNIPRNSNVLFIHTGGATVLSAYAHLELE